MADPAPQEQAAPPTEEGEARVEIHKPKRWRGFRGFIKEYLIIVVGVLTALGAEQGAEWLHWKHLAREHDEDLRASSVQIIDLAMERLAVAPCARGELKRMAVALRAPGDWKGSNPPPDKAPGQYLMPQLATQGRPWPNAAWDAALGDGSLPHLSRPKVSLYAFLFKTAREIQVPQEEILQIRTELTPLAFDAALSAEERSRYLAIIAKMDGMEAHADSMARSILIQSGLRSDMRPDPADMKQRLGEMAQRMPQSCIQEPDFDAIVKSGVVNRKDG